MPVYTSTLPNQPTIRLRVHSTKTTNPSPNAFFDSPASYATPQSSTQTSRAPSPTPPSSPEPLPASPSSSPSPPPTEGARFKLHIEVPSADHHSSLPLDPTMVSPLGNEPVPEDTEPFPDFDQALADEHAAAYFVPGAFPELEDVPAPAPRRMLGMARRTKKSVRAFGEIWEDIEREGGVQRGSKRGREEGDGEGEKEEKKRRVAGEVEVRGERRKG